MSSYMHELEKKQKQQLRHLGVAGPAAPKETKMTGKQFLAIALIVGVLTGIGWWNLIYPPFLTPHARSTEPYNLKVSDGLGLRLVTGPRF